MLHRRYIRYFIKKSLAFQHPARGARGRWLRSKMDTILYASPASTQQALRDARQELQLDNNISWGDAVESSGLLARSGSRRLQVRRSSGRGRTPAGSLEYCTPLVPRAPGPRPAQTQYAEVSRLVYAGERSGARTKSKVAKSGCAAAVPCAMSDERWMGTASRLRGRDAIARADAGPRATRAIAARSPVVEHGHERR